MSPAAAGGGGTAATPAAAAPSGDLSGTLGGTIAENASSGTATVKWLVNNPVSPKVVVGTTTLSTAASGNQSMTLGHGPTAISLSDGALSLATLSISMECVAGTSWDGNACKSAAPAVYKYVRLDLVIEGVHATISKIDGETVTPLANASDFTGNAGFPLVLCALWDKLLTDGRPLASCVTPLAGNTRRNFPINPLTNELMKEYTGAVPAGAVLRNVGYGTFGDTPYAKFGVSAKGRYIDVPDNVTYYITDIDSVNLRLTKDGFATNKIEPVRNFVCEA